MEHVLVRLWARYGNGAVMTRTNTGVRSRRTVGEAMD
jgi:hypothetical protein